MSTKISLVGATIAAAVAASASADVTWTLANSTWTGFNFTKLFGSDAGSFVSGSLTAASVNATLNASTSFTYADDLCIYVDALPLSTGGLLQVGGFSNLSAQQRYFWPDGGSSAPGTTVSGTVTPTNALSFTGTAADAAIWLGNGYGAPDSRASRDRLGSPGPEHDRGGPQGLPRFAFASPCAASGCATNPVEFPECLRNRLSLPCNDSSTQGTSSRP